MKRLCLFLFLLANAGAALAGEPAAPVALPSERYAAMRNHSPFAIATAGPVVDSRASFAANWFVTSVARLGNDEFVTIKARDQSTQFSLFGREANPQNGIVLASINWSEAVGKSTVVLRKGTETAQLEFNEAEIRKPSVTSTPRNGSAAASPAPGASANNATPAGAKPETRRRIVPIPGPR
jgi:hypothetical protein